MASYRAIIEGLTLLASLEPDGLDAHGVQAEHDELYAGTIFEKVPAEISDKLRELGWHESDADCWAIYT